MTLIASLFVTTYFIGFIISFSLASYQDIKFREVPDYVWIPVIITSIAEYVFSFPSLRLISIIGVVGVSGFLMSQFGYIGTADFFAFALFATNLFYILDPVLITCMMILIVANVARLIVTGANKRHVLPYNKYVGKSCWLPVKVIKETGEIIDVPKNVNFAKSAIKLSASDKVVVDYGHPVVAYIGIVMIGYSIYMLALLR